MPSIKHDGPIDVIRNQPDMTADLVRLVTPLCIPPRDRVRVELGSTDASNVVPDEFKADMVTVIRDKATGDPLLLVVIEPQGRDDHTKRFSWPAYLANLRSAHKCHSAVLIVVCWNAAEAERCRAAIPMGHPGYILTPIVIGPRDGRGLSGRTSWLTVLAGSMGAIDLATDAGRRTVLDAIRETGCNTPVTRTLHAIILGVAPDDAARSALEALMETKEYRNDFADRYEAIGEARGEAIGEARGVARGVALGEARGEARGEAKALLKIIRSRKVELTREQEDRITSCLDSAQLDHWLDNALGAITADDVFKD